MTDYSKGLIYRCKCSEDPRVYYGSTINLDKRIGRHKYDSKTLDTKFYRAIREYGFEKFTFEIVEKFSCGSKEELERKEFDYIEALSPDDLFNSEIKYKELSEETKRLMSEAWTEERKREWSEALSESRKGSNNPNFKGGSVRERKSTKRWVVQWNINGKQQCKGFSYGIRSTLTSEQAELLAREFKSNLIV